MKKRLFSGTMRGMKKLWCGLLISLGLILGSGASAQGTPDNRNIIPLKAQNYDTVIRENIISRYVDEAEFEASTENFFREILRGKDSRTRRIVYLVNVILGSIALLWLFILGVRFVLSQGDEEKLQKYKAQFGWIILGLVIIAIAEYAAFDIWDPADPTNTGLDEDTPSQRFADKLNIVKTYIQYIIGGIMLITMMMSGYDLIVGSENDETIEKEKKFFQSFFFGAFFILIAEVMVRLFAAQDTSGQYIGTAAAAEQGITEIVGIVNFVLSFVGGCAFVMMILASLYYVISFGDEDQMNRAKRIILSSVIGIIVAFSSYTLIRFMIRGG